MSDPVAEDTGLLAALERSARSFVGCKVLSESHAVLGPNDFDDLLVALADAERFTAGNIVRELAKLGVVVGASTIRSHRRGECACPRG